MTIRSTIAVGLHAFDQEISDMQNAVLELLGAFVSSILSIAAGGTNSGTALSGSSIMTSNGTQIVQGAAGTTTTLLHGNAAGAPTYSAVSMTADVTGTLPIGNGGTGSATQNFVDLTTGQTAAGAKIFSTSLQVSTLAETTPATNTGVAKITGTTQTSLEAVGGIEMVVAGDGYAAKIQQLSASGAALVFALRNASATWTEAMRLDPNGRLGIGTATPQALFDLQGSERVKTTATSAGITLDLTHRIVYATTGVGGITLTLPAATANTVGLRYDLFKVDSGVGALTITPSGTDKINGAAASKTVATQWAGARVTGYDSTGWIIDTYTGI